MDNHLLRPIIKQRISADLVATGYQDNCNFERMENLLILGTIVWRAFTGFSVIPSLLQTGSQIISFANGGFNF
jgi:hypothetical protein